MWSQAERLEVVLGRLSAGAAEQIMRAVLGPAIDREMIARVVAHADGNAFYIEELIRLITEGEHQMLPETVLSLVESRLRGLPPVSRRLVSCGKRVPRELLPGRRGRARRRARVTMRRV